MSWMTLEDEADLHALAAVQCEEADPTHCALCAARALLAVAPEPQTVARTGAQQTQRTRTQRSDRRLMDRSPIWSSIGKTRRVAGCAVSRFFSGRLVTTTS